MRMVMLALLCAVISDCFSQENTPWMHDSVHRVREVVVVSSSSKVDVIPVQRLKGKQSEWLLNLSNCFPFKRWTLFPSSV